MFDAAKILENAKTSPLYLRLLNWSLDRTVPFNKPHGFRITKISDRSITTLIPYKRRNMNHIKGLHACALATLSEFTTGFMLLSRLDLKKYRLIMQRLEMEYHYQGKMDAFAEFAVDDNWMKTNVYEPLQSSEAVVVPCEVRIVDAKGNHLTTGIVYWQIKDWQRVKTKA